MEQRASWIIESLTQLQTGSHAMMPGRLYNIESLNFRVWKRFLKDSWKKWYFEGETPDVRCRVAACRVASGMPSLQSRWPRKKQLRRFRRSFLSVASSFPWEIRHKKVFNVFQEDANVINIAKLCDYPPLSIQRRSLTCGWCKEWKFTFEDYSCRLSLVRPNLIATDFPSRPRQHWWESQLTLSTLARLHSDKIECWNHQDVRCEQRGYWFWNQKSMVLTWSWKSAKPEMQSGLKPIFEARSLRWSHFDCHSLVWKIFKTFKVSDCSWVPQCSSFQNACKDV